MLARNIKITYIAEIVVIFIDMTERINIILLKEGNSTGFTFVTVCKSNFNASCSETSDNFFGMPKRIYRLLNYENLITYGAMLTVCKS